MIEKNGTSRSESAESNQFFSKNQLTETVRSYKFIGFLLCMLPLVGGGYLIGAGMAPVGIALIALGAIGLLLVSLISSALDAIILAALYLYAADREVPQQFDSSMMRNAFATR